MDEVRSIKRGVWLSAAGRIGRAVTTDSETRHRSNNPLLINLGVVVGVLAIAIGTTFYIWHDVGATAPMANAEIQEIERLLGELSFTPGLVDGVMDNETAAAIHAFQQAAGLPEDGRPSPALLDELKAVSGQ